MSLELGRLLLARAKEMRKKPTEPGKRMWNALRDSRLAGHKFRRQAVIGWRIVDFFCPAKGLVIEIDGHTHDPDIDAARDGAMLRDFGFGTVRFTNRDVMTNIEGVHIVLISALNDHADRWVGASRTTSSSSPLKMRWK